MNYYKMAGQVTSTCNKFLARVLYFKNIESFTIDGCDTNIKMKNGTTAKIVCLEPGVNYVSWSVKDFEGRAIDREGEYLWKNVYNPDKFQEALDTMIRKHDASIGINWDVIDYYLDDICLI